MYLPSSSYRDNYPTDTWKDSPAYPPYQSPAYPPGSEPNRSGELLQPRGVDPSSAYSSATPTSYSQTAGDDPGVFEPGDRVTAQYIDGEWYTGTVWSFIPADDTNPNGTYTIKWDDGSISDGVPPQQMRLRQDGQSA